MKKVFYYPMLMAVTISLSLLSNCNKNDNLINSDDEGNCSVSDLAGRWDGYIDEIGYVSLKIDSTGWVHGDFHSTWHITKDCEIQGTSSYSFTSGSNLITAGATWNLQMEINTKNSITGILDISYTSLHNLDVALNKNYNSMPEVTTTSISNIKSFSANSGGNVISDGGATVTERGVCWDTVHSPTRYDSKTTDGSGLGSFTSLMYLSWANITYYVRAYATNEIGTAYGNEISFKTLSAPPLETGTVTDFDGNLYETVKIGNQWWMAENLKTTHYHNGNIIPHITDNSTWSMIRNGAYCWYNNDAEKYKDIYGALYTWYTVVDSLSLCPIGWHVPTDDEFTILVNYLGGENIAGGSMKETGTDHWITNFDATNNSGFTGLPGGYREGSNGTFKEIGQYGYFWSATAKDTLFAASLSLLYRNASAFRFTPKKYQGFSVRCLKD